MLIDDYKTARKRAQKAYRSQIMKGAHPYLQMLDDILSFTDVAEEENLGLVNIPLDQVIGTKSAGRTRAFAENFMPLLPEDSEFAFKWMHLYESQLEEGIREPVIACEFMNRFYIVEGNKRVSVMKYVGADSISGYVTRIIPKRNDTTENRIYYEFLEFYEKTRINYIWFSQEGGFARLIKLSGKKPEDKWESDELLYFRSCFVRFSKVYKELGGTNLQMTAGDALLVYLDMYGYDGMWDRSLDEIRRQTVRIWEDLVIFPNKPEMELVMQPAEKEETSIFSRIIPALSQSMTQIAFIHDRTSATSGWTYSHELGRAYLQEAMSDRVLTTCYENANTEEQALSIIEKAVADGNTILFITSPKLLGASIKAAVKYPEIKVLNCSLNTYCGHLRTYYGRLYEAKFLTGVLAGILTDNDRIGYLADYPIFGSTACINAFALGVKMINPRARIHLKWSTVEGEDPQTAFRKRNISYVSGQDIINAHPSRQFGLYDIRTAQDINVASPMWNWGQFYERMVRNILEGTWKKELQPGERRSINYWWGMSAGIIDVVYSQNIPAGTKQLVELLKSQIIDGTFHPFSGEIYDQEGNLRNRAEEIISPEQIITMDWLVDNVEGSIPGVDDMKDFAKPIVELQGIYTSEAN